MKAVRFLGGLALLGLAELAAVAFTGLTMVQPAQAQFFEPRYPSLQRQRGGGFFDSLFGGGSRQRPDDREIYREAPVDNSRAPAPRKDTRADQVEPTTSIVVLGDGMADWLASGLEDAFGDAPEIAILRKAKQHSGLLRYDARNDQDWWHVARDLLANEKASYVVMMIGVGDRQNLRERDVAKEAEQQAKDQANKDQAGKDQANKSDATGQPKKETDDEGGIVAPEPKAPAARRSAGGAIEFRSEPWEKVYTRRIDDTIAALKSKGVPVFWVGLPPIRGTKSTADTGYLNDLYRARAEKAGAVYVDVWDGFVDEEGKYTNVGPDYEGQMRRLRSADGVYFTKYGARKLAHYVEREIRRYMANRGPIALPMGPAAPLPSDGKPAARPLAGPVVPLTAITGNNDELVGGSAANARADVSATAVLVKGDAVQAAPGRADDFVWPPGSERPKPPTPVAMPAVQPAAPKAAAVTPSAPAPVAPAVVMPPAPAAIVKPEPAPQAKPVETKPAEPKPAEASIEPKPAPAPPRAVERPRAPPAAADNRQRPPQHQQAVDPRAPRPPQGIAQQPPRRRDDGGLFGLFR
ncbi:SGNH/GDSL hydrolase family protein [Undibacter mobilis]|nr:DUF459 domain-containing protein [Undibacter mobilis]